mmetsp:Transcript_27172/g.54363  ORF Transcript_27172/g.54363 Transcript_27172/m.54363 type:complete len:200 (+) Transcript_27172:845-1444(+)
MPQQHRRLQPGHPKLTPPHANSPTLSKTTLKNGIRDAKRRNIPKSPPTLMEINGVSSFTSMGMGGRPIITLVCSCRWRMRNRCRLVGIRRLVMCLRWNIRMGMGMIIHHRRLHLPIITTTTRLHHSISSNKIWDTPNEIQIKLSKCVPRQLTGGGLNSSPLTVSNRRDMSAMMMHSLLGHRSLSNHPVSPLTLRMPNCI